MNHREIEKFAATIVKMSYSLGLFTVFAIIYHLFPLGTIHLFIILIVIVLAELWEIQMRLKEGQKYEN